MVELYGLTLLYFQLLKDLQFPCSATAIKSSGGNSIPQSMINKIRNYDRYTLAAQQDDFSLDRLHEHSKHGYDYFITGQRNEICMKTRQ